MRRRLSPTHERIRRPAHALTTRERETDGPAIFAAFVRIFPADRRLPAPLPEARAVTTLLVLSGLLVVFLLVYLGFALLFPEKLS